MLHEKFRSIIFLFLCACKSLINNTRAWKSKYGLQSAVKSANDCRWITAHTGASLHAAAQPVPHRCCLSKTFVMVGVILKYYWCLHIGCQAPIELVCFPKQATWKFHDCTYHARKLSVGLGQKQQFVMLRLPVCVRAYICLCVFISLHQCEEGPSVFACAR